MRNSVPCLVLVLAAALAAQGPPTFVPAPHMVRFCAEDVPELRRQLPSTSLGKLLAEPETAAAFAAGLAQYRALAASRIALLDAVVTGPPPEIEPWVLAQLPAHMGWRTVYDLDLGDLQRIELLALTTGDDQRIPATVLTLACNPRAEGRWSAHFRRHEAALATSKLWAHDPEAKFAGFPLTVFAPADRHGERADAEAMRGLFPQQAWLLHLPGVFALGTDAAEACGSLAPAPARPPAQVLMEMDAEAYVALFVRQMGGAPPEFRALGLDGLRTLRWRLRFDQGRVLDELEFALADEPHGAIGAVLTGTAALPAQALPDPALAQLRCTVDVAMLVPALEGFSGAELPAEARKQAAKAFTGGIALGVSAPARGSLIPRLFLSLGIADANALDALLALLAPADRPAKTVTYEGVACTVLSLPDAPAGLQPAYCRRDGALHVAESGLSMRAFLKAQASGAAAMDTGDAPLPTGPTEALPNFDLRWDEHAIYATYHANWLPLLKLLPSDGQQPLVASDLMPSPEAVAAVLGKGRGVLRRDGATFTLQQLGALGGLATGAIAMTWGPLLSGLFHHDYMHEMLRTAFAKARLQATWTALEAFQKQHGRWPNDLGELIVTGKLPPEALQLPGDPAAEAVPMPAGQPAVRSSFRYFAPPIATTLNGEDYKLLLVAIAPCRHSRPMLADTGAMPENYGEESRRPIDQFGK